MRRYRCDFDVEKDSEFEIQGELFKHIVVVCRNRVGERFELLRDKFAYLSELIQINKKTALLKVIDQRRIPDLPKPYIHLVLANPKTSVLESVLEKSVELGVKSIFLLTTERSFFKSIDKIKLKEKRLEKIISQALQQSNRHEELILEPAKSLSGFLDFFDGLKSKRGFILYEKTSVLDRFKSREGKVEDVYLLVGAEGGFTADEADLAVSSGFEPFSLGHQILRVETACVAGVSILKSNLQIW